MRPLGIGVVGAGRIGRLHAENAARTAGVRVVAVADACVERAQAAVTACGTGVACTDPAEVLAHPEIDAVLVCSSTETHLPLLHAAAAAGKHVFCEKPLDLDPARIATALEAVTRAGVLLQVGFNRRFDAGFARIARGVQSGEIGRPELLRITSRDPEPPSPEYVRGSGGMFVDMTIHDFDLARFLLQDEIVEVHATGASLVDPGIGAAGDIDTAVVTLRFASGALGCIDNSRRAAYGYDQRAEVLGATGCLAAGHVTPDAVSRWDRNGQTQAPPLHFFLERYRHAYVAELQAFVDAVQERRTPPVTGHDGLQATRIALAARRSLLEQRPVAVECT